MPVSALKVRKSKNLLPKSIHVFVSFHREIKLHGYEKITGCSDFSSDKFMIAKMNLVIPTLRMHLAERTHAMSR